MAKMKTIVCAVTFVWVTILMGCAAAPKPVIAAPQTPQGQHCAAQCDSAYSTCMAGCEAAHIGGPRHRCTGHCADAYTSCMKTCQ
jgi:hypothetical protein